MNFAIVGAGKISERSLAPAIASTANAHFWSVYSRDTRRAQEFANRHGAVAPRAAFTNLEHLLADPKLDAVIIATPDRLHAEHGILAARAGKHVLMEKPMTHDVESARALIQACQAAGVQLGVAYHLRWHVGHRALIKRIRDGELGPLRHFRAQWTLRAKNADNWRAHDELGRWWSLARTGTHLVDLARWTLLPTQGEVTEVRSLITRSVWNGAHDETAVVLLRFASGASAELTASVIYESVPRVEIYGAATSAICESTLGPFGGGHISIGGMPLQYTPQNPYVSEVEDFVVAVRDNRAPEVPGEEGLRNVEILAAACP
jgi:predicted dehydrogenase